MLNILVADTKNKISRDVDLALNTYLPGCQVINAGSGAECLDMIKNGNHPDAVILGSNLSDMSGLELTEYIREHSDMPIIILSFEDDIYALVRAFDAGANDYIVHPFNSSIFAARIKALVRRRVWDIQEGKDGQKK